jgi:predicted phage tail protein
MTEFDRDLQYLLDTAKDAVKVLRNNAEYFEAQGSEAHNERDALCWLNLAIQIVQNNLNDTDESVYARQGEAEPNRIQL